MKNLVKLAICSVGIAAGPAFASDTGNPCIPIDGGTPQFCIMRAERFFISPFKKHRSCGITDRQVIEVDIDEEVPTKTSMQLPSGLTVVISSMIEAAPGIPVPKFSTERLVNYWISLNPVRNNPDDRILLKTEHFDNADNIIVDGEDLSIASQRLIQILDQQCPEL